MTPVPALPPGMSGRESRAARRSRPVRDLPVKRFVRCWPPSPIPIPPGGRHLFLAWRPTEGDRWSPELGPRWAASEGAVSELGGPGTGYAGFGWIDPSSPGGKRRQQRPALSEDAMAQFLAWRRAMLHLVDLCRAAAPRLAGAAPQLFEEVAVPHRRQVGGVLAKRSVVVERVHWGWMMAEWGLAGASPGVRSLRRAPVEAADKLYLLSDGGIVLRLAGPNITRPIRFVDDADFVQMVHREGLSDQLRRRLAAVFDEAGMAAPFVPNRPSIDHADVWGKVARPGAAPGGGGPGAAPPRD